MNISKACQLALVKIIIIITIILVSPAKALAATLSLNPSTGIFNKGCDFSLTIDLDTTGIQTDGTDAILRYDTTRFTAKNITSGSIYPDFPGNNICENNALCPGTGTITVSGLASVSVPFTGKGTLATINFTVLPNAQNTATAITFEFDPNDKTKTTDSNVVERGTVADVLNSVVNGNYTVGSGTNCLAQGATTLPGTGLRQGQAVSTPSAQPKTIDQFVDQTGKGPGTPQLTFTIAIVGSILTILGILGLVFL